MNSSRNWSPTPTPAGLSGQSAGTPCVSCATAGAAASSSAAATGRRRERRGRPPRGSGRERSRGRAGRGDGGRDGVVTAGRGAPASRRTHLMALDARRSTLDARRSTLNCTACVSTRHALHAGVLPELTASAGEHPRWRQDPIRGGRTKRYASIALYLPVLYHIICKLFVSISIFSCRSESITGCFDKIGQTAASCRAARARDARHAAPAPDRRQRDHHQPDRQRDAGAPATYACAVLSARILWCAELIVISWWGPASLRIDTSVVW